MASDSPSFAELIEKAQRVPDSVTKGDIASPFGIPLPPDHRVVDDVEAKAPNVPEYEYKSQIRAFAIPGDEDAYNEVMDLVLGAKAILRYEEKSFDKEGQLNIVVAYMLPTGIKKKRAERLRQQEEEDDLFPPRRS